jgi:hypothetical protein
MSKPEEIDLEKFVDMFDTAMNSDNPAVKRCFNNLLMVVALAHAEDKEKQLGPLRKLVNDVTELNSRMATIEKAMVHTNSYVYNDMGIDYNTPPIWTTTGTNYGSGYVPPFSGATSTFKLN